MESPSKGETSKGKADKPTKGGSNESEEELTPPSPIHIASEPSLASEFGFPDAQELRRIESDTQNRLKAILEVAGVTGLTEIDARTFQDPEILRKLTNSVSSALDEAATALTRMKSEKQTYEAFLRGANQAPPPLAVSAPTNQQQQQQQQSHPAPPSSSIAMPTSSSGGGGAKGSGPGGGRMMSQQKGNQPQALPSTAADSMQTVQRLLTQGHTIQEATEDGESLLSLACSAGYYELAEVLLRMRASVEDRGVKGDSTPLMEAASGGYADIVKLLIEHGANVNAKSSVGNTALTYACCGGYEDVVRILLDAGADVEHQNDNGHTPLMEAASCGHVGVAKLLLEYGANINTHSNEFKESALTLACYKGHLEMVKFLLSAGADQEHKTDEMHTALMEASMDGHVDVARLLLDHGAQVNMPMDSFESPLTLAACGGHYELAALLISRGADLEEVNDEGYTPLMEGAREGHEEVVKLLVEHGANVNAQTEETQETALTLASCGGFIDVVQYLIEHGGAIELGASTPLMEAAQEGHVNIVKYLIEKGANIHGETNTGDSALTYACANGHTIIADILLQCAAELEHESEGGRTPLMKAARAGHIQTVQFLVSKGADVNRRTSNNDHTVLSLASAGGHVSVVQFLLMRGAEPSHMLRDNSTMLIEASRGGHTNVANLLLRQPRDFSPIETPSCSPLGSQHSIAEPSQATTSSSDYGRGPLVNGSKNDEVPGQNDDNNDIQESGGNDMSSQRQIDGGGVVKNSHAQEGGGGGGGEGVKEVSEHSSEVVRSGKSLLKSGNSFDGVEIDTSRPKRQKMSENSVIPTSNTSLPHSSKHALPTNSSGGTQHSAVSTAASNPPDTPEVQYATDSATAMKNIQHWTAKATTSVFTQPTATTSSTTTATAGRGDTGTSVDAPSQSQQQAPPLSNPATTIQRYAQFTPDDIIQGHVTANDIMQGHVTANDIMQGHVTAEEIITRYRLSPQKQANSTKRQGEVPLPLPSGSATPGGVPLPPPSSLTPITMENAQSVFSSGNFSNQVPLVYPVPSSKNTPQSSASGSCDLHMTRGVQPEEARHNLSHNASYSETPPSSIDGFDGSAFPNMDLRRLIPHLEALADLLQNPTSLETQYLAALAAKSQIFPPSLPPSSHSSSYSSSVPPTTAAAGGAAGNRESNPSNQTLPNNLEALAAIAAHVSHMDSGSTNKSLPSAFEALAAIASQNLTEDKPHLSSMDISNLLSSSDFNKLIPTLAAMEIQGGMGVGQHEMTSGVGGGPNIKPITDPSTVKRLWDEMLFVESNLGYVGGSGGPILGDGGCGGDVRVSVVEGVDGMSHPRGDYMDERSHHPHPLPLLQQQQQGLVVGGGGGHLPKRSHSLTNNSFLLDGNFKIDIPPPGELSAEDNERNLLPLGELPSGYHRPLEQESFPTSEEDDDEEDDEEEEEEDGEEEGDIDDEESDSSYLAPDLSALPPVSFEPAIDVDQQTESNHDTALTLAAAGGHDDLVELLINHGANLEHRDKKGCTPLILAASAGHAVTVAILLDHNADIEAQSDRTKDTALSLACSGGRQEVVELLLAKGANYEHRNVSDYTPLSLAASGGYVNIIKLLLKEGADINSRTGSKLGISPLMLAAMNGHTSTVKLLLDKGSDINAQIETNRNTALTLACFQGRHEVVNLLVERQANVEHRAKTGLTPLMEAASGGYHEVGKVLISKGADVNAAPVPSSKDTALTIAADKGHYKFVDLILRYGAHVDVKNKKGNSPLWLAANGGHLDVVRLLVEYRADVDSQDNRKVSCLMASFRKGHFKVVKYLVDHVSQFPSDAELTRYIHTLSDKDILKKCQRCMEVIIDAKERQAAEANKNATILLQEIDNEKKHEEDRKAAAARKRAKKKRQKEKKQQALKAQKETEEEGNGGDTPPEDDPGGGVAGEEGLLLDGDVNATEDHEDIPDKDTKKMSPTLPATAKDNATRSQQQQATDSSLPPSSPPPPSLPRTHKQHTAKKGETSSSNNAKKNDGDIKRSIKNPELRSEDSVAVTTTTTTTTTSHHSQKTVSAGGVTTTTVSSSTAPSTVSSNERQHTRRSKERDRSSESVASSGSRGSRQTGRVRAHGARTNGGSGGNSAEVSTSSNQISPVSSVSTYTSATAVMASPMSVVGVVNATTPTNSPRKGRKEDGWKEVGRRTKKVSVHTSVFSQVLGKSSCNLNTIKQGTNTQIEVDKHSRQSAHRILTVRGSADAIKHAQMLIHSLARDPSQDIASLVHKLAGNPSNNTLSSASSSSSNSAHKRHVTSSQDPPLLSNVGTLEEPSDAPPAKGSTTAVASINVASSSTLPSNMNTGKAPPKKAGGVPTGGQGGGTAGTGNKLPGERASIGSGSGSRSGSLGKNSIIDQRLYTTSSLSSKQAGLLPGPILLPPPSSSSLISVAPSLPLSINTLAGGGVSSGSGSNKPLTAATVPSTPTSSGAVRRLFSGQPNSNSNTGVYSLLGPQPAAYSPPVISNSNPASGSPSLSSHPSKPSPAQASKGNQRFMYPAKSSGTKQQVQQHHQQQQQHHQQQSGSRNRPSNEGSQIPSNVSFSSSSSSSKEKHVIASTTSIPATGATNTVMATTSAASSTKIPSSMYSSVISTGSDTQGPPVSGSTSEAVIEQPFQQITRTQVIFPETATQLSKPKKKSTYSDAVGKKNDVSVGGGSGGGGVGGQGNKMSQLGGSNGGGGGGPGYSSGSQGPSIVPPQQQQQQQPQQQHKLNLAPGSRPNMGDKGAEKRGRASIPWNELTSSSSSASSSSTAPVWCNSGEERPQSSSRSGGGGGISHLVDPSSYQRQASFDDDQEKVSMLTSSLGPHLGPIGPPSRNSKPPQSGIPPPLPPVSTGGGKPSSGPPSVHSFSPSSHHHHHSKSSPPSAGGGNMMNPSPHQQRNEMSPSMKSPLLGAAPPGILSPPDKGGHYGTSFRPIQQIIPGGDYQNRMESPTPTNAGGSGSSSGGNNYPMLAPTPVRGSSRPPLLATPPGPGYYGSPVPSPEKHSPNKSPPQMMMKGSGFNPNAPTFVPMALQRNTNPPPTSSILGAPPSKYPVFGPPPPPPPPPQGPGGGSILGNAPPLPPGGGGGGGAGSGVGGGGVGGPPGPGSGPFNNGSNQGMVSPPVFPGQQQQSHQQPQQQPHQQNLSVPGPPQNQIHHPSPSTQSSILGQPPTPPLNPHHPILTPGGGGGGGGTGGGGGGPQNFHNIPPRPHGHGQAPVNQPVPVYARPMVDNANNQGLPPQQHMQPPPPPHSMSGGELIQQQQQQQPPPPHIGGGGGGMGPPPPPPYGMNMMPFQPPPPPVQNNLNMNNLNMNGQHQQQPHQHQQQPSVGLNYPPGSMKDAFSAGNMDHPMLPPPPGPPPPPSPLQQPGPPPPAVGSGGGGVSSGGVPSGGHSAQYIAVTSGADFPSKYGLNHPYSSPGGGGGGQSLKSILLPQTQPSQSMVGGSGIDGGGAGSGRGSHPQLRTGLVPLTPSSGCIVMTQRVFSGGVSNTTSDPSSSAFNAGGGGATSGGNVAPIGTERKSATLSAFPITSGFIPNVWSYQSSKDNDWSKLSSQNSGWPSILPDSSSSSFTSSLPGYTSIKKDQSGGGTDISFLSSQDTLESVLKKLSMDEHLSLFQENEIDLNALKLMSETDFAEIGLPPGHRKALLDVMKPASSFLPSSQKNQDYQPPSSEPLAPAPPSMEIRTLTVGSSSRPSSRQH